MIARTLETTTTPYTEETAIGTLAFADGHSGTAGCAGQNY